MVLTINSSWAQAQLYHKETTLFVCTQSHQPSIVKYNESCSSEVQIFLVQLYHKQTLFVRTQSQQPFIVKHNESCSSEVQTFFTLENHNPG